MPRDPHYRGPRQPRAHQFKLAREDVRSTMRAQAKEAERKRTGAHQAAQEERAREVADFVRQFANGVWFDTPGQSWDELNETFGRYMVAWVANESNRMAEGTGR